MSFRTVFLSFAAAVCLLTLPLAGCTGTNTPASSSGTQAVSNVWIAKNENATVSEGMYRYYLASAYSAANNYREDYSKSVFDQQIEGKSAEEWIRDQALNSVKNQLMINDLMKEYKLTVSADDALLATRQSDSYWSDSRVQQLLQGYGITKEDVKDGRFDFEVKNTTVFEHLYSTGDKAVSDEELERYLKEHYTAFRYVLRSTYANYESLPKDELAALRKQFEGYAAAIKQGTMSIEDAALDLAKKDAEAAASTTSSASSKASSQTASKASDADIKKRAEQEVNTRILDLTTDDLQAQLEARYPKEMLEALREMKNGEVRMIEAQGYLITVVKDNINSVASERIQDPEGKREILIDWKGAEYSEDMQKRMETYTNFQLNEKQIERDLRAFFEPEATASSAVSSPKTSSAVSGQ